MNSPFVLVTGGHGDLAHSLTSTFHEAGCEVMAPSRAELDLARYPDHPSLLRYFSQYVENLPVCDLLILNAGITRDKLLARLSPNDFQESLLVNLSAAHACAQAVADAAHRSGKSTHILFVGSFSALHPSLGQTAYATSKAGLLGLTHSLAEQWGTFGTRVNLVMPGFLLTRMTANLPESIIAAALAKHTLGRFTTPARTANFIKFLHFELPDVSGQIFSLDSRPV